MGRPAGKHELISQVYMSRPVGWQRPGACASWRTGVVWRAMHSHLPELGVAS